VLQRIMQVSAVACCYLHLWNAYDATFNNDYYVCWRH